MSNDELIPGFCGRTPAQHQPDRQPQSRKDMQRRRILGAAGATNMNDQTWPSLFPSSPHLFLFSFFTSSYPQRAQAAFNGQEQTQSMEVEDRLCLYWANQAL